MIYIEKPRGRSLEDLYKWADELTEKLNRELEIIENNTKNKEKEE